VVVDASHRLFYDTPPWLQVLEQIIWSTFGAAAG
jgi:hypothetical protein